MHERPIGDLVEVLLSIGAEVEYVENEGYPPLRIRGKKMRGGFDVTIAADTSSQFASSLMMAGATLPDGITLRLTSLASASVPRHHRGHPRRRSARSVERARQRRPRARRRGLQRDEYRVEGDYSSASYWFAAAAATRGTMRVRGLAIRPRRATRRSSTSSQRWDATSTSATTRSPSPAPSVRGGTFDCNAIARHRPDARRDRAAGRRRRSRS